jgi:hypothetical protein
VCEDSVIDLEEEELYDTAREEAFQDFKATSSLPPAEVEIDLQERCPPRVTLSPEKKNMVSGERHWMKNRLR